MNDALSANIRNERVRIDFDESTGLDDIAIADVTMFRMQWVRKGLVWVCAYTVERPDGYRFWLRSKRKIKGNFEGP